MTTSTVEVNATRRNYERFLKDNFSKWIKKPSQTNVLCFEGNEEIYREIGIPLKNRKKTW